MYVPLLHYIAVEGIEKSYQDPFTVLMKAAVDLSKADAKAVQRTVERVSAQPGFRGRVGSRTRSASSSKPPADMPSGFRGRVETSSKPASISGEAKKPATMASPIVMASAAGHIAKPGAQVVSPSRALVSPTGQSVSSKQPIEIPSGHRGAVDITPKKPVSAISTSETPSSRRSAEEVRAAPVQQKMEGFRSKQAAVQAARPKAAAAQTPSIASPPTSSPAEAGAEEAAKPPAKVKEKKPSLFFRPEGEEAKPTAKKRGYANIMGAYSTGVSMSPGGAGAGARVLSVAGWKTALRAHRLLNARSGGGGGMRQITTQMGPRIRTGSMR